MKFPRLPVAALVLTLSGFLTLVGHEDFVGKAMIPTKGDRVTIGHGSTSYPDGSPIKMGDTITPMKALIIAKAHIDKEEISFRKSLPNVELQNPEYDLYMDWVYQYGTTNWWNSSIRRNLLKGDHVAACNSLLLYKYAAKYDCSTLINGVPNKRCYGVWTRQLNRHTECMALQ